MMDKRIVKLSRDPFRVGHQGRPYSIFIDPKSGTILIDEGEGENRLNGVVMYPDKAPVFSLASGDHGTALQLDYCGYRLVAGSVENVLETQLWILAVNQFLTEKAAKTPKTTAPETGG